MRLRATAAFVLLFGASVLCAEDGPAIAPGPSVRRETTVQTVLTPDSTLYAIDAKASARLDLSRHRAELRDKLLVPGTDDEAIESQARIAYDRINDVIYVLWHRAAENLDEIRLASVNAEGTWSDVQIVATGADVHRGGLQMVLTRARAEGDEFDTTLVHAAWWSVGAQLTPEYAVIAFEGLQHVSTEIADLETLGNAEVRTSAVEAEEVGQPEHPPLVLSRAGRTSAVDAVFGSDRSTGVTRVRVEPQRTISSEARIWRPSGRSQQRTGPTRLIPNGSAPVQAFVAGDRVVLYTPDEKFRFVVHDGEEWTPIRTIELDENLSTERVIEELRRSVEETAKPDEPPPLFE